MVIVVSFKKRGNSWGMWSWREVFLKNEILLQAKLLCEHVVIVVSLSERGLSWATWIVRLSKLICGHLVIVVSFTERGHSEGMRSLLLAKLLCEMVVIVVILSERGWSWAVLTVMLKTFLFGHVIIVVSFSEGTLKTWNLYYKHNVSLVMWSLWSVSYRGCSEAEWSLMLANLLCEQVIILVSLTQRGIYIGACRQLCLLSMVCFT